MPVPEPQLDVRSEPLARRHEARIIALAVRGDCAHTC